MQKIGPLGEELVARFLVKRGYKIIGRNFRRPWGELDVIAEKKGKIHFVEVKTVSCESADGHVTHETSKDRYRAEDNVHPQKIKRLSRIIQTYLSAYVSDETPWQFDVATVLLDQTDKRAKIELLEDIVL